MANKGKCFIVYGILPTDTGQIFDMAKKGKYFIVYSMCPTHFRNSWAIASYNGKSPSVECEKASLCL